MCAFWAGKHNRSSHTLGVTPHGTMPMTAPAFVRSPCAFMCTLIVQLSRQAERSSTSLRCGFVLSSRAIACARCSLCLSLCPVPLGPVLADHTSVQVAVPRLGDQWTSRWASLARPGLAGPLQARDHCRTHPGAQRADPHWRGTRVGTALSPLVQLSLQGPRRLQPQPQTGARRSHRSRKYTSCRARSRCLVQMQWQR